MSEINKVEALRILREKTGRLSAEQKAIISQGFNTPFWKVLATQLSETLDFCRAELETAREVERIRQVQGEISALRVLLDWSATIAKEGRSGGLFNSL